MGWETKFCLDQAPPILALYMRRFCSKAQKGVYSSLPKTNLDYSAVKIQFWNFLSTSFWSCFWLPRAPLKDLCIKCLYLHIKNLLCEKCKKKDWKMFSNCLGSFLLRQTYPITSRNKFTNVERTWKYNFRGGVTTFNFLLLAILDSSVVPEEEVYDKLHPPSESEVENEDSVDVLAQQFDDKWISSEDENEHFLCGLPPV